MFRLYLYLLHFMMVPKNFTFVMIEPWIHSKNVFYVSNKNFIDQRAGLNITNTVFDNTAKHTHLFKPIQHNTTCDTIEKYYDVFQIPFSHQNPQKSLINTKECFKQPPNQGPGEKRTLAVNKQLYTNVPETRLQNYYTILQNDPLNQAVNPARSTIFVKNEVIANNLTSNLFNKEEFINVRSVQELVNTYPVANTALQEIISTPFVKPTCGVLEPQFHELIDNRNEPKLVKTIVLDMEKVLNYEKTNIKDYTVYEQTQIQKAHYFMVLFKNYIK